MTRGAADWAFCSVVSDDFAPGFINMHRSFASAHAPLQAPFYVIHDDAFSPLSRRAKRLIRKYCPGVTFRRADPSRYLGLIQYAISYFGTPKRLKAAFLILDAFLIEEHELLIAIDSDVLFLAPITELLDLDIGFGAVRAEHPETGEPVGYINTGLLVLGRSVRNPGVLDRFEQALHDRPYIRGTGRADQALVNLAFGNKEIDYLPSTFNLTKRSARRLLPEGKAMGLAEVEALLAARDVRLLHYVAEKPWAKKKLASEREYESLEALWTDRLQAYAGRDLLRFIERLERRKTSPWRFLWADPPADSIWLRRLAAYRDAAYGWSGALKPPARR